MGGSGGGPTSSTTNTSNLPEYARPYFERMMGRAEEESNQPYVPYQSPRLADFTSDARTSFDITRGLAAQGTPELNMAGDVAAGAVQAGQPDIDAARSSMFGSLAGGAQNMEQARGAVIGAGGMGSGDISSARNLALGSVMQGGAESSEARSLAGLAALRGLGAGQYSSAPIQQQAFGREQAQRYMSPYMDEVLDRQKAAAVQDFEEGRPRRETEAIRSGAFGGYRSAIQEGVAQRGLGRQLSDIEASGRQKAFENAQAQYERDRMASMSAQGTTEQQRLLAAQYGLSGADLGLRGAQSMGQLTAAQQAAQMAAAREFSQMGGAERDAALRQAGLLGQFAASEQQLGLQGAEALGRLGAGQQNLALQQAEGLGQVGTQRQALTLAQAQALQAQGGTQQQQRQRELDLEYQNFLDQREANKQNINFMSSILRGVPVQPTKVESRYDNPSALAQFSGLGIAGLGLARSQ
jgi:hypothetical protein